MPVYNTDPRWLRRAIDSVSRSNLPSLGTLHFGRRFHRRGVRAVIEHYASEDPRIRVIFVAQMATFVLNSNSALRLATGEFVVLLDSDDELPAHALFWVAKEINDHPCVDLIYSDEDKIDIGGRRYEPYFQVRLESSFSYVSRISSATSASIGAAS